MKHWHYALIVFLGGCSYGILSTFVKLAYDAGYSAAEVTGGQYLFGMMLIWFLVFVNRQKSITKKQTVVLILSGIPTGLTSLFYYQALKTLDASLAIIFLFQFVWIGSLFEWIFYKRKPSKEKWISIIILLIGSLLAGGLISSGMMNITWQGTIWGMLSAITFAAFIFLSGAVGKNTAPLLKSALLSTGGLIVVMIVFPPVYLLDLSAFIGVAKYGLILGIFGVVLPPLLFTIGMPKIGPGLGTILSASELPVAVLMSAIVLHEYVSGWQWIGVVMILGGIVIGNINLSKRRERKQSLRENII